MAEKIIIASGKGGVGKSTAAVFLGRALADRGKKVLLIDADTGLGALDILLGVHDKTMNTWLDAAQERCSLRDAFLSVKENLTLLPSPRYFPDTIAEDIFGKILEESDAHFDYIFLDAPAGIDESLKRAAVFCEKAVFVATADEVSVRGAAAAAEKTEAYGIARENMRLVINRFVKKSAARSRLLNIDGVIDKSGIRLLGILPEDKKIPCASVTQIAPGKKSKFAKAVKRVAMRIDGISVPLVV